MTKQRMQLLAFCILLPLALFGWYLHDNHITLREFMYPAPWMRVGDVSLKVNLASTPLERERGLSGRDSIGADGMLFIFPKSDYHGFWMKDMRFPIDMIWISEDLKVVHIEKNVSPDSYPHVFRPTSPARYILETDAHFADTFDISLGQRVVLPPKVN